MHQLMEKRKNDLLKVIFIMALTVSAWPAFGQVIKSHDLTLNIDTQSFYKEKRNIRGIVENHTQFKIFYELGIETFYEGKWIAIIENLDYPAEKSVKISFLAAGKSFRFSFDPKAILDPSKNLKRFRFFIKYGKRVDELKFKDSFPEFRMNWN